MTNMGVEKMKFRNGFIATALVVTGGLMAGQAMAADTGGYIGVSVGTSKADIDQGELDRSLASLGVGGTTTIDDKDTAFKIYGGYQFNRNFAIEGGYTNLGKFTSNTIITSGGSGTLSGEWKAWSLDFTAVGILPLGESASLFGRAGVSAWSLNTDFRASGPGGVSTFSESSSGVSGLLAIGGAYNFTPQFGLRAEFERHFSVGNDDTGKSDIDLITVGLVYRF